MFAEQIRKLTMADEIASIRFGLLHEPQGNRVGAVISNGLRNMDDEESRKLCKELNAAITPVIQAWVRQYTKEVENKLAQYLQEIPVPEPPPMAEPEWHCEMACQCESKKEVEF